METCIFCESTATYIRHTQFAGSHPFCMEHAKAQSDFMSSDWECLITELRNEKIENITNNKK